MAHTLISYRFEDHGQKDRDSSVRRALGLTSADQKRKARQAPESDNQFGYLISLSGLGYLNKVALVCAGLQN